jgi:hypothetical protein
MAEGRQRGSMGSMIPHRAEIHAVSLLLLVRSTAERL